MRRPESPRSLGVVFEGDEVFLVSGGEGQGAPAAHRFSLDERRALDEAGVVLPEYVSTVVPNWSARSRIIEFGPTDTLNDLTTARAIVAAAEGGDGSDSIFTDPLDEVACDFTRGRDEQVVVVDARRQDVEAVRRQVASWLTHQQHGVSETPRLVVETRARAVARVWLAGRPAAETAGRAKFVVDAGGTSAAVASSAAFFVASGEGYSIALWSAQRGIVYEVEEMHDLPEWKDRRAALAEATTYAVGQLAALLGSASLEQLQIDATARVVVAATEEVWELVRESLAANRLGHERLARPGEPAGEPLGLAEATALGLVLRDPRVAGVDLSEDIRLRIRREDDLAREFVVTNKQRARVLAGLAMAAPLVAALAVLVFWRLDIYRESVSLDRQIKVEEKRQALLNKENSERISAEKNFKFYEDLTNQTLSLRFKQPATAQLLPALNEVWPPADGSWFVSEVRTVGPGKIQIKGRTKDEGAVTAFARALELGGGQFNSIQTTVNNTAAPSPNSTFGSVAPPAPSAAPAVYEFTIVANYAAQQPAAPAQAGAQPLPAAKNQPGAQVAGK